MKTLTQEQYDGLQDAASRYYCLESAGVDSWEGYEDAMEDLEEYEPVTAPSNAWELTVIYCADEGSTRLSKRTPTIEEAYQHLLNMGWCDTIKPFIEAFIVSGDPDGFLDYNGFKVTVRIRSM